jgi:hypothetical protein
MKAQLPSLDFIILIAELKKRDLLDKAGGAAYVSTLSDGALITNAEFYAGEVLTAFRGRATWKAVILAKEALERGEAPDDVSATLTANIETITAKGTGSNESGISFNELLKKQFPAEDWFVEGLITSGLTVLTGASKIGKSWTALQLVTALDNGGSFLGVLKCQKCDVLYCALEDTPKRIQKRIQKQGFTDYNGSRLETKRRTIADLRSYLKENPQFRVVIIDTLQKMMGISDLNDYAQTVTGISALKDIADTLGIAVVIIHHNRKGGDTDSDHMDSALGSTGIVATADAILTMRRKRGDSNATLSATGRDFSDTSYTLAWDKDICTWAITGQGSLQPTMTEAQQQIIDLLESEDRNWTTGELVEKTGKTPSALGNLLSRMKSDGLIDNPFRGQWQGKTKFTNSHSLRESEFVNLPEGAYNSIPPSLSEDEIPF